MLTDDEISALFKDMESDRVERKREYKNKKEEIRQAICAFANDLPNHRKPGVVFIGQADDGTCSGLDITDELLRDVSMMRNDGRILPFPVIAVRRQTFDGSAVAVVIVAPSDHPPVRIDGRSWIRVGPRRGAATAEEERRLAEKQVWHNLTFDARPCEDASLDDLDLARFEGEYVPSATSSEIRRKNGRSTEEKLRALRFLSRENKPTNAALLLFGKDPRRFFPGAYIQFLRIDGTALTDPITDNKEITGPIPDQIHRIEELVRLNIRRSASIGGAKRVDQPDYPVDAFEQILRNAVLHRVYDSSTTPTKVHWYSDRVEVINPGGLYGDVNPDTIWRNATAYRNPMLAEGLKVLGVVERFGFGLVQTKQALERNGNPPLQFEFIPNFTLFKLEPAL